MAFSLRFRRLAVYITCDDAALRLVVDRSATGVALHVDYPGRLERSTETGL